MRQVFTISLIVFVMLLYAFPGSAATGDAEAAHSIQLWRCPKSADWHEIDVDNEGHRMPPKPMSCTISKNAGVEIPFVDKSEIISFSIYDNDDTLIASFINEDDFITYLFSYRGELIIRFNLHEYNLIGYLSI